MGEALAVVSEEGEEAGSNGELDAGLVRNSGELVGLDDP